MKYKVTISYDGYSFAGWQKQNNTRTAQGCIEDVIKQITAEDITIIGSGRTDAGVHALGQVFHFESNKNINTQEWQKAFNALLPQDIFVIDVKVVSDDFHARYDVKEKTYHYLINIGEYSPLNRNYQLQFNKPLNIDLMQEAAIFLKGRHDFTSFNANSLTETPNQVRTIYDINISQQNDLVIISLTGDGFLRYMIRMIVATLIKVGEEKISTINVKEMLELKSKQACNFNVAACGLYLVSVKYD